MKIIILCFMVIVVVQSERRKYDIEDFEDYSEWVASRPLLYIKRVLICTNKDALEQIMPNRSNIFNLFPKMEVEFHDVRKCLSEIESDRHGEKSILAVIAPKPFEHLADSEVPIYFYEAPYFLEDVAASHSNIVPALIDWRPLKHAFTHFFKQQDWIRIAIVSDYSPYSAAFEEELVGHFNEQGLVYNVQRCVETIQFDCDFQEAMGSMKENKAVIVVANIEAKNALDLARVARTYSVTRKQGFVWLARDWPFEDVPQNLLNDLGPIVSLTLAPMVKERITSQLGSSIMQYGETLFVGKSLEGPHIASILQGLTLVDNAVRHTNRTRIDHFYRNITEHMNAAIKNDTYDSQAFIRQIGPNFDVKIINIVVANSRSITSYTIVNYFNPQVYDVKDCVMMRSNVYTDPCNDVWISLIVLVVLVFILIFFLILYAYIRCFDYLVELSKRRRNWSFLSDICTESL